MENTFVQKWTSQVKKGTLGFIVLSVLRNNEFYGYELIDQIKNTTQIDIAEGTLYPLLLRLKKEGLVDSKWVEQESGIPRKYYSLTERGNINLEEMKEYWAKLNQSINKIK